MYGEPIDPRRASFSIFIDESNSPLCIEDSGRVSVVIQDEDEHDNDDIRDILNPRFEQMFENMCENIFTLNDEYMNLNLNEVRQILLPMGFEEKSMDEYGNIN